jgi:hypothetical protein
MKNKNLIIGDFNAHHVAWGGKRNTAAGLVMVEFCEGKGVNRLE